VTNWHADWAWSLPLIVLNVVIHVLGLGVINERIVERLSNAVNRRHLTSSFVVVMGAAALVVTVLHAFEGAVWATAYRLLGALPDNRSAMLYSLSAITSYGHAPIFLEPRWQMMGALEALNGMMLFGLTTAFLFKMIQDVWPLGSRVHRWRDREPASRIERRNLL
jgi:hypothetical protein